MGISINQARKASSAAGDSKLDMATKTKELSLRLQVPHVGSEE